MILIDAQWRRLIPRWYLEETAMRTSPPQPAVIWQVTKSFSFILILVSLKWYAFYLSLSCIFCLFCCCCVSFFMVNFESFEVFEYRLDLKIVTVELLGQVKICQLVIKSVLKCSVPSRQTYNVFTISSSRPWGLNKSSFAMDSVVKLSDPASKNWRSLCWRFWRYWYLDKSPT